MKNTKKLQNDTKSCKKCGPCEKGTTSLIIGFIFIAIGAYSWFQNGFIPTSAILAAPPFLIIGFYLRYIFIKGSKAQTCPVNTEDQTDA